MFEIIIGKELNLVVGKKTTKYTLHSSLLKVAGYRYALYNEYMMSRKNYCLKTIN